MRPSVEWSDREQEFYGLLEARHLRTVRRHSVNRTLRALAAFFADALFREEAARRPGLVQRVDPRARLLATLLYLVSLSLARSISGLLAHALLPLVALPLARIRPQELLRAGLLVACLFSTLMAAPATLNLVSPGEVILPLWQCDAARQLGPYTIPRVIGVSREGLGTAATFLLRVLASVAAVLCLTLTTRWVDLVRALRILRLPPLFLQVAGMAVRYLPVLLRQSEEAHFAKQSRSLCRAPLREEQAWVGARLAHAWERGLHLMEEVSEAMLARGFSGRVRFPPGAWFRSREWALLGAVTALCVGTHLLWG